MIRVSKVGARAEADLLSPTLQRTAIEDYAAQRGMVVVEWVEATDESGSQRRSPWWVRLDKAVEQVERGERDAILVWKFSRAARWRKAWAVALDRIEVAGGVLESATEQLDTQTSTGRLARGMLAELAAWEAEVKGEQWKETHRNRVSRGLPHSGRRQWGYSYERERGYAIDPTEAAVVAEVYRRYISGETPRRIAAWLNEHGHRTVRGYAFDPRGLLDWMDRGFCAGYLPHNDGSRDPGAHEPIIPPAQWQAFLRRRAAASTMSAKVRHGAHHYAGLLRCGLCGAPMSAKQVHQRKGWTNRSFVCNERQKRGTEGSACPGVSTNQRRLDELVKDWLEAVAHDLDMRAMAKSGQSASRQVDRQNAKAISREVVAVDEALERLTVQFARGLVPEASYRGARDELLREKAGLERRLHMVEHHLADMQRPPAPVARSVLRDFDAFAQMNPSGLRDLLAHLIDHIDVFPGQASGPRSTSTVKIVARWE